MKKYKIGEIARLLGTTTQALRFYEQEGVFAPGRSENGTRYYTESDIIRLLAFKRYRLSEFSVQDIVRHFRQGSMDSLMDQLDAQSDALIEQSLLLMRRAQAIRGYERMLREMKAHADELMKTERPAMLLHDCTFDELDTMDAEQTAAFSAYIEAMPDAMTYFTCHASGEHAPEFRLGIGEREAHAWGMNVQSAIHMRSIPCVRIYVRRQMLPWQRDVIEEQIARVQAAGYTLRTGEDILGVQLASETVGRKIWLFGALYIPVDES
ncbi:MAG: MerR family transcriptional regulator [Clostridia bacterium]|nr:MerR family transcriptional regulator [Clostridia bacterium]